MDTHPPSTRLPLLALCTTALAAALLGGATGALLTSTARPHEPAPPAGAGAELDGLRARLDHLEAELARAVAAPREQAEPAPPDREPAPQADAHGVQQRLAALEHALAVLASQKVGTGAPAPAAGLATAAMDRNDAASLAQQRAASQQAILDPGSSEQAKLAAWSKLRNLENSYDDAVVGTMTQLGLSAASPTVRADVWRQADGRSKHPAMAPALVQALQLDREAKVREEAAETLANYLDVPGVRQALETASSGDADEDVRRQATNSLRAAERRR